jgi:type II secretory pathway pseudopilin PulG
MKGRIGLAAVGVVVVVIFAVSYGSKRSAEKVRQERGTITQIDLAQRMATIEIIHPRSGQLVPITGFVPEPCEIRLDDRPAGLGDLRVGDRVVVEGRIDRDKNITARWIHATRAASPAAAESAAASAPAPVPAGGADRK